MTRATELLLTVAVATGVALALRFLRRGQLSWWGILHGVTGAAGLFGLLLLIQGPRRGEAAGTGSFGAASASLLGVTLLIGLFVAFAHRRLPRAGAMAIAVHACCAITGFVLFLAWISVG